jgi:ABC-type multidrug transport system ATPase subunit
LTFLAKPITLLYYETQRLSTVRNADRIAVIEYGKVREIGTHEQLMLKPNGLYRRLQQLQNLESAGSGFVDKEEKLKTGAEGQTTKESDPKSSAKELELSDTEASKNSHRAWQIGRKYISCKLLKQLRLFGVFSVVLTL